MTGGGRGPDQASKEARTKPRRPRAHAMNECSKSLCIIAWRPKGRKVSSPTSLIEEQLRNGHVHGRSDNRHAALGVANKHADRIGRPILHAQCRIWHLTMHWYPTPISIGRPRTGRNRAAPNSQCEKKKRRCGNTTDKALKARSLPDPGTPHRPLACRMGRAPTSAPASSACARSS